MNTWIWRREVQTRVHKYAYAYSNAFQITAFTLTLGFKTQMSNSWHVIRSCRVEKGDVIALQQYLGLHFYLGLHSPIP